LNRLHLPTWTYQNVSMHYLKTNISMNFQVDCEWSSGIVVSAVRYEIKSQYASSYLKSVTMIYHAGVMLWSHSSRTRA
jgi:hypothetical protein